MKELYYYQNFEPDTGGSISGLACATSKVGGNRTTKSNKSYISIEEIKEAVNPDQIKRVSLPIGSIHGTQMMSEYGNMRMRRVKQAIRERGHDFLVENPPLVCFIPESQGATLAAIDGHHRIRGSGAEGIDMVPCEVIDISTLTDAVNHKTGSNYTSIELTDGIQASIYDAKRSFRVMPDQKQPQPITGITDIQDLSNHFPIF